MWQTLPSFNASLVYLVIQDANELYPFLLLFTHSYMIFLEFSYFPLTLVLLAVCANVEGGIFSPFSSLLPNTVYCYLVCLVQITLEMSFIQD